MTFEEACRLFGSGDPKTFDEASRAIVDYCRAPQNPFDKDQVVSLASALAQSGQQILVPDALKPLGDIPSTGGPASLTTLLCPLLLAATGVHVLQLSATGSVAGAVDTMTIIDGFRAKLSPDECLDALREAGIAHVEPHETVCPADKSLIGLRRKTKLMPHKGLAAASLLGKKLAVPGTCASFDFRLGPTGNIGHELAEAESAARLFSTAANALGIGIVITITDNRSFPCTALGRMESLDLLWAILNYDDKLPALDKEHLDTCLLVAARGWALATGRAEGTGRLKDELRELLVSGRVLQLFGKHLEAQGTSITSLQETLHARQSLRVHTVRAAHCGLWRPPDLGFAKEFVKRGQAAAERMAKGNRHLQFGLRLLASPGQEVAAAQPVMEIRYPEGLDPDFVHGISSGSAVLACWPSDQAP